MYFLLLLICLAICPAASASIITYTSSAAFVGATNVATSENFQTLTVGQHITAGSPVDGLTYSSFVLTLGATALEITPVFNSFSGLSLGADHTSQGGTQTFFYGGEGATITFSQPVDAFGIFFNVNPNSGSYGFGSSVGSAMTGSTAYDTGTFVFAGLVSTTPFASASFDSVGTNAVFNIPELLIGPAANSIPEPASLGLGLAGCLLLAAAGVRRRRSRMR